MWGDRSARLSSRSTAPIRVTALHFRCTSRLIQPGGFSSSDVFGANEEGFLFTAHLRDRNDDTGLSGWAAGREAIAEPAAENSPESGTCFAAPLGTGMTFLAMMVRVCAEKGLIARAMASIEHRAYAERDARRPSCTSVCGSPALSSSR